MIRHRLFVTAAFVLAVGLGGCGGGGGGGPPPGSGTGPTPTPSPAPAPAPTPSPTPAAILPPAPFGITASQQFQPFGWHYRGDAIEALSPQLVDFRWSASARTYEMVLPDVGRGRLEYLVPGTSNLVAFRLVAEGGQVLPVDVMVEDTGFFDPPYRHSGIVLWTTRAPAPVFAGQGVFGFPTNGAGLPRTGQITYLTQGTATADALIAFDFGAGSFSGYVRLAWEDAWGPHPLTRYDFTQMSFVPGTNSFEAVFTVPGAPRNGRIRGQFMGPNAEEIAVAWRGPVQDPYTGEWVERSGVSIGRNCSRCENPG